MNEESASPDLILHHGSIKTLDPRRPDAQAVAVAQGVFTAVGGDAEVLALRGPRTQVIDIQGRTAIPGLNDTHLHLIRGGLNFNMELRWDGVPSLADALRMLREQARRTPPPQWVRVVGGWSEFQFAERRLPTLEEINEAASDTPVFLLHLYDRALLNQAALRAVGYTKDTPQPPGGVIERDKQGNPTGLLVAKPNAMILYKTLALESAHDQQASYPCSLDDLGSNHASTADIHIVEDHLPLVRGSPGAAAVAFQPYRPGPRAVGHRLCHSQRRGTGADRATSAWRLFRRHSRAARLSGEFCVISACFPQTPGGQAVLERPDGEHRAGD